MRKHNWTMCAGVFRRDGVARHHRPAQKANPRFGRWKLKSDAPRQQSNVMTYEPYNGKGMKIAIDAVNKDGVKSQWGYTTMFDGKDETLVGNPGTDTDRFVSSQIGSRDHLPRSGGKVTQILTTCSHRTATRSASSTCVRTKRGRRAA